MASRFVILAHSGYGPTHYDLMLQRAGVLATWQFAQDPADPFEAPLTAHRIQDHRPAYLSRQGPVSGGRGRVDRVDEGAWQLLAESDGRWDLLLRGRRIAGRFELAPGGSDTDQWTFRRLSPAQPPAPSSSPEPSQ